MPTPLPPKGTVLQTAEFADSLYSPVLMAFVSCVSSTFFQPARSGSHLYSAHRNTVRSGHQVMVLHTLVGIRHLRGCLTLTFCTLIVSQLGRFVKGFLKNFSKISSVVATGLGCNCPPSHPRCEWSLGHIVLGLPSTAP